MYLEAVAGVHIGTFYAWMDSVPSNLTLYEHKNWRNVCYDRCLAGYEGFLGV
jgi:hypothetical protein